MDLLTGKMLAFILVLTRVGAFFAASPVFSWESIPRRIKISIAILISIFFAGSMKSPVLGEETFVLEAGILITSEAIYGLALGFTAAFIFAAVKLGARIAERQMGMAMANILDPLTGDNGQPVGMIIEIVFILLFLSANGHHMLLMTISKSYQSYPVGTVPDVKIMFDSIVGTSSLMLMLGLKMAGPIMGAFLLLMVVLAVLSKVVPETNILFLALPLRVGMGLLMVGIFLPFISNFIKEFAIWMDKFMPL